MNAVASMLLLAVAATSTPMAVAQQRPGFDGETRVAPPVLPPYRLAVTPPVEADENQPITLRPEATVAAAAAEPERTCTVSVRPDGGSGASHQGLPDAGCMQATTLRLPVGAYWARLSVRWRPKGSTAVREDTHDVPYKVRSGDRLRLQQLRLEPAQPLPRTPAKLSWELVNSGPVAVTPAVVELRREGRAPQRRTRSSLLPGETWREAFVFTADEGERFALVAVADPDGSAGEREQHRANNRAEVLVDMGSAPPPTPLLIVGDVVPGADPQRRRPTTWSRALTICNVDPDARYVSVVTGPRCLPMPCGGPYSGTPSRGDFRAGAFAANGATLAPACPAGLPLPGGLSPGALQGPIGLVNEHRFELTVHAEKNGRRSAPATLSFTVPPNCRPPCVETER